MVFHMDLVLIDVIFSPLKLCKYPFAASCIKSTMYLFIHCFALRSQATALKNDELVASKCDTDLVTLKIISWLHHEAVTRAL